MIQWFSEDIREEALLIKSFFEFIKDYDLLVHYNGSGFDIPYLTKCEIFAITPLRISKVWIIIRRFIRFVKYSDSKNYKQRLLSLFLM